MKPMPIVNVARVTVQTRVPLSIGAGRGDGIFDTLVVRDANGLPVIPGTSLAGVLRHAYQRRHGKDAANVLFGYADRDEGTASRVQLSWGHIHDSCNHPVEGLVQEIVDPILAPLVREALPHRERVHISDRGVATDMGKFDRSFVPKGHRFTFELTLWSDTDSEVWADLLQLITSADFRLGGLTRSGFGKLHIERFTSARFDLRDPSDLERYAHLSPRLGDKSGLEELALLSGRELRRWTHIQIKLKPEGGWRIGQGKISLTRGGGKQADLLPQSEVCVLWKNDQGYFGKREIVVPATSVKGALSHRVAFHYNCLIGNWATSENAKEYVKENQCDAVRTLFGFAKGDSEGSAGRMLIDDVYLENDPDRIKPQVQLHNSIDRFTGSVRDGALFGEENLYGDGFALDLDIEHCDDLERDPKIMEALRRALQDLVSGRLALGAASARGLGYFSGELLKNGALWSGETR
jgi:CRISPR/Cas system CMR subunit Cmr4 (Cas7 group RAMP superfamily)